MVLSSGILLAACAALQLRSPESAPDDSVVVITGVAIVDARQGTPRPRQTVVIRGNRIAAISSGPVRPEPRARVVDGRGGFLIPGLWDLHVHLGSAGEASLPQFVAYGVTGVRDMGTEQFEPLRQLRIEILAGSRVGPRIVAAGPIIDGPTPDWPLRVTVRDAREGIRAADSLAAVGVDFFKVHQQLGREAYFAVASEARRLNLPFAGHVPVVVTGLEAAAAGQRSLEHMTGVPDTGDSTLAKTLKAFRQHGTWIDPTLSVYWVLAHREDSAVIHDSRIAYLTTSLREFWEMQKVGWSGDMTLPTMRKVFEQMKAGVRALHAAGVPLLTGTDLGFVYIYPGSSVHEELERLVESGLTPLDALRAGTWNPARYFGWDRDLGTVEVGKLADLVLLDADPLLSIRNTSRIRAVIANGRLFERSELDRLARGRR